MKPADIHRVEKAITHLDAARTLLDNIKWENLNTREDGLKSQTLAYIQNAKWYLQDMQNINKA